MSTLRTLVGILVVSIMYGLLLLFLVHVRHPAHPIMMELPR
jgi:hypothetical protein